ncbi:hypothetical protein BJ875DRAFT_243923 [Amylocarpus encephaloides]|uniref:Secreted protein n=1 Tax=Amylocarpus encephaloides TaxID=45428 RepID=A0A9P7YT33_9HELO|nr:hypothetical protein BJ875DRAFT_243923 [Amylocarpus encephaloides]
MFISLMAHWFIFLKATSLLRFCGASMSWMTRDLSDNLLYSWTPERWICLTGWSLVGRRKEGTDGSFGTGVVTLWRLAAAFSRMNWAVAFGFEGGDVPPIAGSILSRPRRGSSAKKGKMFLIGVPRTVELATAQESEMTTALERCILACPSLVLP